MKNFIVESNQSLWDNYYSKKLNDWMAENPDKLDKINTQKTSIAQYKPILLEMDAYINKPFAEITLEDYESFKQHTTKQSKFVHVQGFFVYCISNGLVIVQNRDFVKNLIPEVYRRLIKFLV